MTPTKVSSCVDCATSIIGARPRCPSCYDQHATTPTPGFLSRWGAAFEILGIVGLTLVLVVKGCS
jgi:hypothetical protein